MQSKKWVWTWIVGMGLWWVACGSPPPGVKATGSQSQYDFWLMGTEQGLTVGKEIVLDLTVAGKGSVVPVDIEISQVTFIHTAMGHGSNKEPKATKVAAGKFQVKDVVGSMPGKWALSFVVGSNKDKVTYDLDVK